jgi:predicted AAA+ superfamily ATPase
MNPWWRGASAPRTPPFRRWPFPVLLRRLRRERMLAPIIAMRGPRQVGKTTLQAQLVEQLLADGVGPERIFRVQFDELATIRAIGGEDAILQLVGWYQKSILGGDFNDAARAGKSCFLLLDEVQNLPDWAVQLKSLVDHAEVRVLVTGSSALRIELGRDSLAGRIQSLEIGPLRLSEISEWRGFGVLPPFESGNGFGRWSQPSFWRDLRAHGEEYGRNRDLAFQAFSERGGYPLAQRPDVDWAEVSQQLSETVVQRVIQHDLRQGARGRRRDQRLLEEVFRMGARYAGQAPAPSSLSREAQLALESDVGVQRIRNYLTFLEQSLLLRLVEPHEMRLQSRRGPAKICLSDHALRAAWLDEIVPLDDEGLAAAPELSDLAGRIAESVVGADLVSLGVPTNYLPERRARGQGEIDFILTVGDHRIPLEVKYQARIDPVRDVRAISTFLDQPANRAPMGIVVTRRFAADLHDRRVVAVPLKSLLLAR